ncbi:hypothetical protein V9T40_014836 [Parthenolecanium corni]|uniref:Uncharacterized protein n=1 Tax=Parthenolecanium corni TaxID=536013 RepID=A0AAN9T6G5_9HEMI
MRKSHRSLGALIVARPPVVRANLRRNSVRREASRAEPTVDPSPESPSRTSTPSAQLDDAAAQRSASRSAAQSPSLLLFGRRHHPATPSPPPPLPTSARFLAPVQR